MLVPGIARSSSRINATTVNGFHAVGCTTKPSARANKLMAVCKSGYLPSNVITLAPNSAKLSGKTLSQVEAASRQGLQTRVSGSCGDARAMTSVGADGSVTCRSVQDGVAPAGYCTTLAVSDAYAACRSHFTTVDSTGDVGTFTSLAIGADGVPVVSYYDVTNGDLKVAHCGNAACSAGNTLTAVDSTGDVGRYTSIAIGADGFPVVSYFDLANAHLKVAHCTNAQCSSFDTPTTVDGAANVGVHTSIAIGTDGFPVVSYFKSTSPGGLKVAHCSNASCSSYDAPTTVDGAATYGGYSSIAVGTDGFPVVSYYDTINSELKVAECTNVSCSSSDTPTIVDVDGVDDVGRYTSLAIGTDGFPVVSYYDYSNQRVKVAHCTNVSCSSFDTPTIVASSVPDDGAGQRTSIAIGVDGHPVVSYRDVTNGDLDVVHCGNSSCSSGNTTTTVDSPGDVGRFGSLAIGVDGNPVISSYDVTNGDLKVARPVVS